MVVPVVSVEPVEVIVTIPRLGSPGKLTSRQSWSNWMLEFILGDSWIRPGPSMRGRFHFGDVLGFIALSSLRRTGDDREVEAPGITCLEWDC